MFLLIYVKEGMISSILKCLVDKSLIGWWYKEGQVQHGIHLVLRMRNHFKIDGKFLILHNY